MNEACLNLFGRDITTAEGQQFAREVLEYMRERIYGYQAETGNFYNLEATPAEGTSYRLALKDKQMYPDIMVANEGAYQEEKAAPYYTNSSHIPVDFTDDVFENLDLQDELQIKYTGGTVVHLFIGEEIKDIGSIKALVRTICHNYHMPYFTLTPTFSVCPNHGYVAGKVMTCEKCGSQNEVYSRIVGYIRPIQQWNAGKRAEFEDRRTYDFLEAVKQSKKQKGKVVTGIETEPIPFVQQAEEVAENLMGKIEISEPALAEEQSSLV